MGVLEPYKLTKSELKWFLNKLTPIIRLTLEDMWTLWVGLWGSLCGLSVCLSFCQFGEGYLLVKMMVNISLFVIGQEKGAS